MRENSFFLGAAIVIVLAASSLSAEVLYHITDLGSLGQLYSYAHAINNYGGIVGSAYVYPELGVPGDHPVLFDPTGEGNNIDLITAPYSCGIAQSINRFGETVGWTYTCSDTEQKRATLFDPTGGGSNLDLGTPDDWSTKAFSINDAGQIVGVTRYIGIMVPPFKPPPFTSYATLFDSTGMGNHINLRSLGGKWSEAYSINNGGRIVGAAATGASQVRATVFDPNGTGNNINLGILPAGGESYALSVNDLGQIVGYAYNSSGYGRAMLFDPTGGGNNMDLGALPGLDKSWARSINNAGQIVGWGQDALGHGCAVLFDSTGGGNNINLNDVIPPTSSWRLTDATCINDSGWIVGFGENPDGQTHAFLLTPVSTDDFTLRLNVEPNDAGIDTTTPLPGEHKCLKGSAIDLEARLFKSCPAVYHFDHWEGDVVDPNSSLTTVIMDEDKIVTAVFVASEPVCGDECHPILRGDLNDDCHINFADFVLYSDMWMSCTHPDCD